MEQSSMREGRQSSSAEDWEQLATIARLRRVVKDMKDKTEVSGEQTAENLKTLYKSVPIKTKYKQFRLLTLTPSSLSGYIECTLRTADIDATPEYEALSYTWGGNSTSIIKINELLVPISSELEQTLGLLQREDLSRNLWIDAICINQEDIPEKNEQVAFMRTIYQSASHTIVWLGSNRFEIMSTMARLEQDAEAAIDLIEDWSSQTAASGYPVEISSDHGELHNAFSTIVSKRWWQRIWVVQEVAVSKIVKVGYGRRWTDWAPFVAYSNWIRKTRTTPWHSEMTTFHQMIDISTRFQGGEVMTLHDLLRLTASFDATNPRDKIFALLGLATEKDRAAITPDYSADLSTLYARVVRHIIETECSLSVLALAGSYTTQDVPTQKVNGREVNLYAGMQANSFHGTQTSAIQRKAAIAVKEMPSWVSDFRSASYTRARMRYPLELGYNASLGREASVKFMANNVLAIEGVWFGKVGGVISMEMSSRAGIDIVQLNMNTAPPHLDFVEQMATAALKYQVPERDARAELAKSKDDLWRTLILDRGHQGCIPASKDFGLMYECIRGRGFMPKNFEPHYIRQPGGADDPDRIQFDNALFARNTIFQSQHQDDWKAPPLDTLEFVHNAFYAREDRKLFMTCAGLIGMGPREICKDDILIVPFGCHVPLVLRKEGDYCTVIGECYVHGVMDGEVIRILERNRARVFPFIVETFKLR